MLDWLNADRVGVIVAIAAAALAGWYAHRQTGIAKGARADAKRSADAAEAQVQIANDAKAEAQRAATAAEVSADAARQSLKIEARRDHHALGPTEVTVRRTARRPNPRIPDRPNLFMIVENAGGHAFTLSGRLHLRTGGHQPWGPELLPAGGNVEVYLDHPIDKWDRFEAWFGGECPCDQPDCPDGHWRREFRIPKPRSVRVL